MENLNRRGFLKKALEGVAAAGAAAVIPEHAEASAMDKRPGSPKDPERAAAVRREMEAIEQLAKQAEEAFKRGDTALSVEFAKKMQEHIDRAQELIK